MKWGKHLKRGSTTSRKSSSDHKEASKIRQKSIHEMSNDELKKLNTRIELEQKYKKANPSTRAKGQKVAKSILASAGTAVGVYNMVNSPAGKAAMKAGKNAIYKTKYVAGITKAITT